MMTFLSCFLLLVAGSPDELLDTATQAFDAGDLETAALALTEAIAADPQNVDALEAAALVALRQNDPGRAVEYLTKLLELDPQNDDARLELGRAQWLAGNHDDGQKSVDAVLERHPRLIEALTLDKEMRVAAVAPPERQNPLQFSARAGVSGIYDSNPMLDPGLPGTSTKTEAKLLNTGLAAALRYAAGPVPFSVFAELDSNAPATERDDVGAYALTTVTAGFVAERGLGGLSVGLDARYAELYTDVFDKHRARVMSPSLFVTYTLFGQHLRLLGGAELRTPDQALDSENNTTLKAGLRDSFLAGPVTVLVDLAGRKNQSASGSSSVLRTDFSEIDGTVCLDTPLFDTLAGFLVVDALGRKFDDGLQESTYHALLGLRYGFGSFELHGEGGVTRNLSDADHDFTRYQLGLGVRAYYE